MGDDDASRPAPPAGAASTGPRGAVAGPAVRAADVRASAGGGANQAGAAATTTASSVSGVSSGQVSGLTGG